MKSSMKKVLSFVLALAMVVLATVPAFAATGVVDPAEPNDTQIKFCVTKGGLKDDINGTVAGPNGAVAYTDGEGVFTDGDYLEPSTTYVFELEEDEVVAGTPNKFSVTTNAKGQIETVKAITEEDGEVVNEEALDLKDDSECLFEFKLVNPAEPATYTIFTRRANGDSVNEDTLVSVYGVKTKDGEYAYADDNAINQVDYNNLIAADKYTVPASTTNSAYQLTAAEYAEAKGYVTAAGLPIVALVYAGEDGDAGTDDDVVVFTNFSKDKQAVLTIPGDGDNLTRDLKVIVKGLNNPTVAVEGATVEIQKNSTELFGSESFGDAIATGKTNANGVVEFKDVRVADILRYLSDAAINDTNGYNNAFNTQRLPFRAAVTVADGYKVPEYKTLTLGEISDGVVVFELVPSNASKLVKRLAGDTRFDTSVKVARELYEDKNDLGANQYLVPPTDPLNGKRTVILVNGMDFPDALTANGLVKYYDAPILLTDGNKLSPAVQKFIDDYDVEGAIILGGTTAMSGELESAIEKAGITTTRLFGANRYGTSAAVAERIAALNGGVLPTHTVEGDEERVDTKFQAFVASGEDFADALVASVPASIYGAPILLTAKNRVPAETAKVISDYKVVSAIVVGGDAAITPTTYGNLNIATKERIYGENRQLTSMKVAERFFPQAGSAFVAGGLRFPDALVGGALSAEKEAPILLSNSADLTPAVKDYIVKHRITDVTILGGPNAVSLNVENQLEAAVLEASR